MARRILSPRLAIQAALAAFVLCAPAAAGPRREALRSEVLRSDVEGYAMAACLTRQEAAYLREQGYLWGEVVLQRGHGSLDHWTALADAVGKEAARRPMPVARGDGAVRDPLKPMPLLFCYDLVRTIAVRRAVARAMRRLSPAYR